MAIHTATGILLFEQGTSQGCINPAALPVRSDYECKELALVGAIGLLNKYNHRTLPKLEAVESVRYRES